MDHDRMPPVPGPGQGPEERPEWVELTEEEMEKLFRAVVRRICLFRALRLLGVVCVVGALVSLLSGRLDIPLFFLAGAYGCLAAGHLLLRKYVPYARLELFSVGLVVLTVALLGRIGSAALPLLPDLLLFSLILMTSCEVYIIVRRCKDLRRGKERDAP